MFTSFRKMFIGFALVFLAISHVSAFNVQDATPVIADCANAIKNSGVNDVEIDKIIERCTFDVLNEEDVLSFCVKLKSYGSGLTPDKKAAVAAIHNEIVRYLKGFVAQSFYIDIDPNVAFIIDHMTPHITVCYANNQGLLKHRRYAIKIWSVGIKLEFAIRIEMIKIIGSDFNYYDTNKTVSLGKGIEVSSVFGTGISLLYCRMHEFDCGLLITGIPLGISGALSLILGGSLVPVKS